MIEWLQSKQEQIAISLALFTSGYLLNVVWESLHWVWFYIPDLPVPQFTYITHIASLGDGVWIVIIYWATALLTNDSTWVRKPGRHHILTYASLGLIAAAGIEWWAALTDAWTYGDTMPVILGVGISPFIQLATTGLLSVRITKSILYHAPYTKHSK